ncbi:MAG: hypothetical protein JO061_24815 [Acidobacteriaceae bacterium]|nr:hypothetical protein [Acidobacteriaceae bacterium]
MLSPALAQQQFERTYKATAYITVLSIPIFSRSDVGYGLAMEQKRASADEQIIRLEFLGGSNPSRAHGLNRFGYIREIVEESHNSLIKAQYTGIMTASREESLNDAKAALHSPSAGEQPCVAASGELDNREARSTVWNLQLAAPRDPALGEVMQLVNTSLGVAPNGPVRAEKRVAMTREGTFLYSLRQAIVSPDAVSLHPFTYNSKSYVLRTEKHRDTGAESEMNRRSLITTKSPVIRLNGTIENQRTHDRTEFSVWYQEGSPTALPLRFLFRPKSYLKLVFDAQPEEQVQKLAQP